MSQHRQDLGLYNRDGSLSRRAVRMKINSRTKRRESTKSSWAAQRGIVRAREILRRRVDQLS